MEEGDLSPNQPDHPHLHADVLNHLTPHYNLHARYKNMLSCKTDLSGRFSHFVQLAKSPCLVLSQVKVKLVCKIMGPVQNKEE